MIFVSSLLAVEVALYTPHIDAEQLHQDVHNLAD